jgi:hypothetical protein
MTTYTDEQVKQVMDAQKVDRIRAIHLIKRMKGDVAKAIAYAKETPAAKPAAKQKTKSAKTSKAKGERKTREGKYNKDMVVRLYMEEGKSPTQIAEMGKRDSAPAGIKGISPVYCHRILYGNENSGGISTEQAARRKEQAARVKAWAAEKVNAKKAEK